MAEYIDKGELIKFLQETRLRLPHDSKDFHTRDNTLLNFEQYVRFIPVADVAEVKRGEWIGNHRNKVYDDWKCSVCGKYADTANRNRLDNYCGNCGAKMKAVRSDG